MRLLHPALSTRLSAVAVSAAVAAGTVVAAGAASVATAPAAHASTGSATFVAKADRVLHVAYNQRGKPYRYGAAGPNAFDCSGLVLYVFHRALGKNLPHNAEMQYRDSRHIRYRRNLRPGDLVFQVDRHGYAFHVGIYAGHGYMWDAPHTGSHVQRQKMWPARWRYGRIIRS